MNEITGIENITLMNNKTKFIDLVFTFAAKNSPKKQNTKPSNKAKIMFLFTKSIYSMLSIFKSFVFYHPITLFQFLFSKRNPFIISI